MRDKKALNLFKPDYSSKNTKACFLSYPTYEEVYRHVFVHTAAENSGWIVYEIHGGLTYWWHSMPGGTSFLL